MEDIGCINSMHNFLLFLFTFNNSERYFNKNLKVLVTYHLLRSTNSKLTSLMVFEIQILYLDILVIRFTYTQRRLNYYLFITIICQ